MTLSSYAITSNKETGLGRCEHILIPIAGRGDHAIIIDYNVLKGKKELDPNGDKVKKELALIAKAGLEQIQAKQYEATLKQQPHVATISKISLAFCGKEVVCHYSIS